MDALKILLDKQEITELTYKYAWAIDSNNLNMLNDVFLEKSTAYLVGNYFSDRESIINFIEKNLRYHITQHFVSNHIIQINGDTAKSSCQLSAQHVKSWKKNSPNYLMLGIYNDLLVRTDDGWRIDHRELITTWSSGELETPGLKGVIKIPDALLKKR